jgi:hypothetical protein
MPFLRILLALLCCSAVVHAADTAKLRTLTGKSYEGELTSLSDGEIVFQAKDERVTVPVRDVLDIELPASATAQESRFDDVELNDGSLLHCTQFTLKGNQVEAKLVGGLELKIPLAAVSYLLKEAHDAKIREQWQTILGKRGKSDQLVINVDGTLNSFDGTLGAADAKGETIEFETVSGVKRTPALERVQAMSFLRKAEVNAPPVVCKVHDSGHNLLMAARVALDAKGFTITTVSGVKVELPRSAVARLDYSKGKITFLSDLEPAKVTERSSVGLVDHYRRDKNLEEGPLKLAKETFSKGLALHAYTELVYDIGGQYKEFKAVLGVDPSVGGDSHVKVTIEGDGRELFAGEVRRKDPPQTLTIDVKNIKQLRIVVASTGLLDLGDHVNLADAKVSK